MTDWIKRSRREPYKHQIAGVEELIKWDDVLKGRVVGGCFFLGDEMGAGKTKQVIDAAQILFEQGEISRVLVVTYNGVKGVWFDDETGELNKHLWEGLPALVIHYHGKNSPRWARGPVQKDMGDGMLRWVITNYDFISRQARLEALLPFLGHKTLFVIDEGTAIAHHKSKRSKACLQIRRKCKRVWILDGTPVGERPLDMFSKARIMDSRIFGFQYYTHFRAYYAIMKHLKPFPKILGYQNIDQLQQKFAPYILRRLKKDCMDLPPKLEPVTIPVPLTEETWAVYKEMKKELIAWLDSQTVSIATMAATKVLRLAQITSGFLGGLGEPKAGAKKMQALKTPKYLQKYMAEANRFHGHADLPKDNPYEEFGVREIGREKLDFLKTWIEERLEEDQTFKVIIWCRFRPELERLRRTSFNISNGHVLHRGYYHGGQEDDDRQRALRLLKPEFAPEGPVVWVGTLKTGGFGVDLAAAGYTIYPSNDTSLVVRMQADDRPHRTGQKKSVWYGDVVATGPKGQKTVDHTILKALRNKEEMATWTTRAWVTRLKEEEEE